MAANQTEMAWAKVGFSRYAQARMLWNVHTDIRALQWDFAQKMFPSDPEALYNYTSLGIELFSQIAWNKPEPTVREFLRQAYLIFRAMRPKLRTPEEIRRWEWYALYLHEQWLEYNERLVAARRDSLVNRIRFAANVHLTPQQVDDLERQLADVDKEALAAIKALVSYDKAINRFNVLDAYDCIWNLYAPRLGKGQGRPRPGGD